VRPICGLVLVLVLAGAGCARETRGGDVTLVGRLGPESVEGRVRVVGNMPFSQAVVQPDTGDGLIVTGPYRSEIQRLSGARVRVTGRYTEPQFAETTLEASSYEILSVDGDRPRIGRLERDEDGYFLQSPTGVALRVGHVSEPLSARLGALMWVVLDEYDGVARYGILRDPVP